MDFKNSETKDNLMRAFAGESQARNRYTIAASQAHREKLYVIEAVFRFTAEQEREHAEVFYKHLSESLAGDDFVRGNTISAVGFYGPQGREVRLPLANPDLNRRIEEFEFRGRRITNYEMESAPLAGLGKLMGHRCVTVCAIIANRFSTKAAPNYAQGIPAFVEKVLQRF